MSSNTPVCNYVWQTGLYYIFFQAYKAVSVAFYLFYNLYYVK